MFCFGCYYKEKLHNNNILYRAMYIIVCIICINMWFHSSFILFYSHCLCVCVCFHLESFELLFWDIFCFVFSCLKCIYIYKICSFHIFNSFSYSLFVVVVAFTLKSVNLCNTTNNNTKNVFIFRLLPLRRKKTTIKWFFIWFVFLVVLILLFLSNKKDQNCKKENIKLNYVEKKLYV